MDKIEFKPRVGDQTFVGEVIDHKLNQNFKLINPFYFDV